jgi:peptidyl-prolyl cis-trans isomerase C
MTTIFDTTDRGHAAHAHQSAPSTKAERLPRPKPISVNGVTIPRTEIGRETQHHPAQKPIDAWTAAARALVVRELLLQEARRLGISARPLSDDRDRRETDEEALVRQLVEQEVVTPKADEESCRRVYDRMPGRFRSSDLYAVRHILIPAAPGDAEARIAAREQAAALIVEAGASPALFGDLAAAYSACPSRHNGGALGQISRGQTVPEFEAALSDAPLGSVMPEAVETRYGVHVVIVDQRIEGRQLPFDIVRDAIGEWLETRSRETAIRQYIAMLAGRATILGIDLDASAPTLVQ